MGNHLIFVYGTLKRGWGNNIIIRDQRFIGVAETLEPAYEMYGLGGFPGVVSGNKTIKGELFEVDDTAFDRCDRLEGHPNFYKRVEIPVVLTVGDELITQLAWIYIYQGSVTGLEPIDEWVF